MTFSPTSRVALRMGNPHAPTNPWGRDELDIYGDGRVAYANVRLGATRRVAAELAPDAVARLFAAIDASPFPAWTQPAFLVPDATIVDLIVELPPAGETAIHIDYHTALKTPGYDALIKLIAQWVGVLRAVPAKRPASSDFVQITDAV